MKISSIPKSGRKGSVVYVNSRHGKVAREYMRTRNPRTPGQQGHRSNFRAVLRRWRTLSADQHAAWRLAAANNTFVTETGRRVRLNGYNFFASLNTRRADLDLPQFDFPPAEPIFSPNLVAELVITNTGGRITLKLRVPSPPAQNMHMKLVDASTKNVVREEYFNSANSAWAAAWNFGASDRSLPSDMGKIMADYIVKVVPGR